MEKDQLSPEKSFELITQVITQARNKFEENGFIYIFWGALVAIAAIGQFVLLEKEYYAINWYPYLLMPVGGVFSGIYFSKKKGLNKKNMIGKIVSSLWGIISVNLMLLGFIFGRFLGSNLIPVLLILLSIGIIASGVSIKSRLVLISGLIINVSAFICFYLESLYHPLLMGLISILAIFIPGVILMIQNKRKGNV